MILGMSNDTHVFCWLKCIFKTKKIMKIKNVFLFKKVGCIFFLGEKNMESEIEKWLEYLFFVEPPLRILNV